MNASKINLKDKWTNLSPFLKLISIVVLGYILMEFFVFSYEVAYDFGQLIYRWLIKPFV